ncbi:MAG TPA: aspartate 1-decarboxylase [Thermodesulfobacteriota bacterium]|nr:aspartate 1-decarboxylase [Thermodesulfobacteriota bacterium]
MQRIMLKSKIHRAKVTDSNLGYEGSVAIDASLMETSGILPFEKVEIYNVTNGNRFETYAIEAPKGSGNVIINGAAAHLAKKGDIIIIASYSVMEDQEAKAHHPVLVYVDEKNMAREVRSGVKV